MDSNAFIPPTLLYHGTSSTKLKNILESGVLRPRGANSHGNWKGTVKSNANTVYLTTAYPLHFASVAASEDGSEAVVLELRVAAIESNLHADEDAAEQVYRGKDGLPSGWDMKRRTIYYRSRAHLFHWTASVAVLGTCGHQGPIPLSAVSRVATVSKDALVRLIIAGFDPTISILNYMLLGKQYEQGVRWLFGDEADCAVNPKLTREGIQTIVKRNQ